MATPLYITLDEIKSRLIGKVAFTTDPSDENKMLEDVANDLLCEAEGQVELDLSPRYFAPFQADGGGAFSLLPDRPTKQVVKTLCQLQGVRRILETDFGTGTIVSGEKYSDLISKRYDALIAQLFEKKKEGQGWKYPPLPGLKLNYMNETADDGFHGMVIVASGSPSMAFPAKQINDPSSNFWNAWPPGLNGNGDC